LGLKYVLVLESSAVPEAFEEQTREILRSSTWSLHQITEAPQP
jgi:hypothetical protein